MRKRESTPLYSKNLCDPMFEIQRYLKYLFVKTTLKLSRNKNMVFISLRKDVLFSLKGTWLTKYTHRLQKGYITPEPSFMYNIPPLAVVMNEFSFTAVTETDRSKRNELTIRNWKDEKKRDGGFWIWRTASRTTVVVDTLMDGHWYLRFPRGFKSKWLRAAGKTQFWLGWTKRVFGFLVEPKFRTSQKKEEHTEPFS